jgi:general secretion pathway protein M
LQRQTQIAVTSYVSILLFTVLLWLLFSAESRKLQSEFDAKLEALQLSRASGASGHSDASKTAPKTLFAEMSGLTETIAASDLQKRLLEMAADCGIAVHSIQAQVNADSTPQQLRRIGSELTFDGRMESLQQFLFEVETNVPFIFVDAMSVQPSAAEARKGLDDTMLRVILSASSYWKGPELDDKGH